MLPILVACGSDDDDDPVPVAAASTSTGTITAFGSVVVNGIRFDDSAATINMDDGVTTRDRLRLGMVVQVRGSIAADGSGVASSIQYNDCVQGPITAMNPVANTLTVLGQTVLVDDATVFDGVSVREMSGFAVGDLVEVSCLRDPANNRLAATRMERLGPFQNGISVLEVKGPVSNLDLVAGTCTVNGLMVNFAGLAAGSRPTGLANGMTIEAGGSTLAGSVLTATVLRDRDRDRINHPDGDGIELEGYVAEFVSMSSFKVDGQAVNATNAVIRNGTAADLVNGAKVEVEGSITNGVLVASTLVIRLQTNVRVDAGLQAKDVAANTITLLGRAINLNADTQLSDGLASAGRPTVVTTLAGFNVADRLEVRAYKNTAGQLVATRIQRTAADALVVVKGPAEAKAPTTLLTLMGIGVATGANTVYRDASHVLTDATSFYATVQVPPAAATMVHARGVVADLATTVLDATRSTSSLGELAIGAN